MAFLSALLTIELNRQGLLPAALAQIVPTNHFGSVYLAFTLLLIMEVLGLVFALAESVANSVGKQFELLSLILLRKAFLQFAEFGEPIEWDPIPDGMLEMMADAGAALLIFFVLGLYYRVQRHHRIASAETEQRSFVAAKKTVALGLLLGFCGLAVHATGLRLEGTVFPFFEAFYLVLIFSDILIVLVAFRYSASYRVLFRNSGFAMATVIIRLALTAPPYMNAALGVGGALFAVGVSLAYNLFATIPAVEPDGSRPSA